MNWFQGTAQLILLTGLLAAAGMLVAAWSAGSEEVRIRRLWAAWRILPIPVLLWLALVIGAHGFRFGCMLSAAVWLTVWAAARLLIRPQTVRAAIGLLAAWGLYGCALALIADLSPSLRCSRDIEHAVWAASFAGSAAAAVWIGLKKPQWLSELWGPTGIKVAIGLTVLTLLAPLVPPLKNGTWVFGVFAYLVGVVAVAARTAERDEVPIGLYQWWLVWRWAMVMAAMPVALLLLRFRGMPDFSPSLVLTLVLLVTFWLTRQRRAAVILFVFSIFVVFIGYSLQLPHRLVSRVQGVLMPTEARTDQQLQALWCSARGGVFGRGVGHFIVVGGACACRSEVGRKPQPAVLQLPATDSVWGIGAETVGSIGTAAMLVLVGLVATWLWSESARSRCLRRRCWFAAVFTVWSLCHLWTCGWTAGRWPIMGLAAPILSSGFYNALCWCALLALSTALAVTPEDRAPAVDRATTGRPVSGRPDTLLPALTVLLAVWVATGFLQHGIFGRERTLLLVYNDRLSENDARTAVLNGWVVAGADGSPRVADERIPRDLKDRAEKKSRLIRWLKQAVFRVDGKRVRVEPLAFRMQEPSLGSVLRLAGE